MGKAKTGMILVIVAAIVAGAGPFVLVDHLGDKFLGKPSPLEKNLFPQEKERNRGKEIGLPIIATSEKTFLGKSFEEITAVHGMCLLNEEETKPKRTKRVWPERLENKGTAQAEWHINGRLVSVVWLPPGSDGPSCIVSIESMTNFKNEEIEKILRAEAPAAWQIKPPKEIVNREENELITKQLENGDSSEFTAWRMDGASAEISSKKIILKNLEISRKELDAIIHKNPES